MAVLCIEDQLEFKSDLRIVEAEVRAGVFFNERIVIGSFGKSIVSKPTLTRFSLTSKTLSPISRSLVRNYATVNSCPAVGRVDL